MHTHISTYRRQVSSKARIRHRSTVVAVADLAPALSKLGQKNWPERGDRQIYQDYGLPLTGTF
eukprot:4249436-Prymnesium_polylepis.2